MKILPINNNQPQKSNQTFKGSITLEPVLRRQNDGFKMGGFQAILERFQIELNKTNHEFSVENTSKSEIPKYLIKFGQELNDTAKELVETTNKALSEFAKASFKE